MDRRERQPRHQPLSRPERRAQQRKEEKQQKGARNKTPYIISAALGLGALAAGVIYSKSQEPSLVPTPLPHTTPVNPDFSNLPDEVVLQLAGEKLGIRADSQEQTLWNTPYHIPPELPFDEGVRRKVEKTLERMSKSNNQYYRDNAEFVRRLDQEGRLVFSFMDADQFSETVHMTSGLGITSDQKRTVAVISVRSKSVANFSDLYVAFMLDHEIEHIKRIIGRENKGIKNNVSVVERKAEEDAIANNKTSWLQEETETYAASSGHYIVQRALMGGRSISKEADHDAARFSQARFDSKHPLWKTYIKRNISKK